MPFLLVILFVLAEIFVFAGVAAWLGFGWAFLAMLGLMFLGTALAMAQMRRPRLDPADQVATSSLLMVAVLLSSFPGFITSIVAFLIIIPPTRQLIMNAITQRMKKEMEALGSRLYAASPMASQRDFYGSFRDPFATPDSSQTRPRPEDDPNVIDAEEIKSWAENVDPDDFTKGSRS